MFGIFEDTFKAGLDAFDDMANGEPPSKRDIAKLADTGMSIAAIALMTGFTVDTIEGFLADD